MKPNRDADGASKYALGRDVLENVDDDILQFPVDLIDTAHIDRALDLARARDDAHLAAWCVPAETLNRVFRSCAIPRFALLRP